MDAAKAGESTPAGKDKVGGLLESLAAVIPTGIAVIYTLFATAVRTEMVSRGATERAEFQAAQLKLTEPPTVDEIAKRLGRMPLESKDLIELRWGFLVLAAVVAITLSVQAVKKANDQSAKKRPLWRLAFEPLTALVALASWGLAVPGTPLGAYLDVGDLGIAAVMIAAAAGLLLLSFGTRLAEPAKTR